MHNTHRDLADFSWFQLHTASLQQCVWFFWVPSCSIINSGALYASFFSAKILLRNMGELCAVVELMKGFGQLSVTAAAAADLHAPAICVPEK